MVTNGLKTIALAQYAMTQDVSANCEKAMAFLSRAHKEGADLIIYPELCVSPFFPQFPGRDASAYLMDVHHDAVAMFRDKCRQLGIEAVPNMYLAESGACFDASLVIDKSGTISGVSKMVHIAQLPLFFEKDYYAPSDVGFNVYATGIGRIGVVICFDRHFPESIRSCALNGAEVIVIPTANIDGDPREMYEWEMRVAAMQNGVYIAMCNRVGEEGNVTFYGESLLVDPFGEIVHKAGADEELIIGGIDLSNIQRARSLRPYISLLRPRHYA